MSSTTIPSRAPPNYNASALSLSSSSSLCCYDAKQWNRFFVNRWKESFIVPPLVWMIVNAALAVGLSQIQSTNREDVLENGLALVGMVSNASISIVTLTFSLTVLSVQLAAQSYSARLLDDFIKDPIPKLVISVNLGSYVYCYTLIYYLDPNPPDDDVPYVAIYFLTVELALVLITFVSFIHIFINGFRIEKILNRAAESSLNAARALAPSSSTMLTYSRRDDDSDDYDDGDMPAVPIKALKVKADASGYITQFHLQRIIGDAEELDFCITYNCHIGDYKNRGTVLAYVWDRKSSRPVREKKDDDEDGDNESNADIKQCMTLGQRVLAHMGDDEESVIEGNNVASTREKPKSHHARVESCLGSIVNRGVSISRKRSSDLDVTLGIQQLSDIAVRALSPGVNDPYTATQCMDVLTSVLATLATWQLGIPCVRDSDGRKRLWAPRRSFSYLLAMLDPIRQYGGTDLSVCRRALRLYGDLGMILTNLNKIEIIPTVLAQLEQWMKVARENFSHDELKSLEDLNFHILRSIAESDNVVVKDDNGVTDLDVFMTTYNKENTDDANEEGIEVKESLGAAVKNKQDVDDNSMRAMVNDFLSRVNFGSGSG